MDDYIESAKEELKRVDHLIFVSLKYTRTVDVIRNIINRLISSFDYMIEDLFELFSKDIKEPIPQAPRQKCAILKEIFKENQKAVDAIDFYLTLRRLARAKFTRSSEFRKHVTMHAVMDAGLPTEEKLDVDIEKVYEYYELSKKCHNYIQDLIEGKRKKEDD